MAETELNRAVRLQVEKYVREMVYAERINDLIKALPPSDGQRNDTIRIGSTRSIT